MKTLFRSLFALAALTTAACNDNTLATKPEPPTAIIAGPETASPLDIVLFDGSASYSDQSVIEDYAWSVTSRPGGSHTELVPDASDPR